MKGMNMIKAVIALIIGYVLSFITLVAIVKLSFLLLVLMVLFFVVIFYILKPMFGPLISVFGGGVGTLIINSLIYKWAAITDDSRSMVGAFLLLTPLAIVYAAIFYLIDKRQNVK